MSWKDEEKGKKGETKRGKDKTFCIRVIHMLVIVLFLRISLVEISLNNIISLTVYREIFAPVFRYLCPFSSWLKAVDFKTG